MTTAPARPIDFDKLRLAKSSHTAADLTDDQIAASGRAACLLEVASFVAGEPWSDHPECVSPVLGAFGRGLNDVLSDARRQELIPLIPRLIGTADDRDEIRSYLALDWLIRTYLPAWLRLVPALAERADAIAGLPEIVDLTTARTAGVLVEDAAKEARAARDAAWAAARAAARAAAGDAAGDAAWDAAWDAAGDAAWAAAWAAAGDAAGDAAWDAARDAAGDAAGDAAWDAARDAARAAAWDAAGAAARAALSTTVTELQTSAIALFDRLIDPER